MMSKRTIFRLGRGEGIQVECRERRKEGIEIIQTHLSSAGPAGHFHFVDDDRWGGGSHSVCGVEKGGACEYISVTVSVGPFFSPLSLSFNLNVATGGRAFLSLPPSLPPSFPHPIESPP